MSKFDQRDPGLDIEYGSGLNIDPTPTVALNDGTDENGADITEPRCYFCGGIVPNGDIYCAIDAVLAETDL